MSDVFAEAERNLVFSASERNIKDAALLGIFYWLFDWLFGDCSIDPVDWVFIREGFIESEKICMVGS